MTLKHITRSVFSNICSQPLTDLDFRTFLTSSMEIMAEY